MFTLQANIFAIHKHHPVTIVNGSYETITDESGNIVEKLNFDPWGRRRNPLNGSYSPSPFSKTFDRGYTGHQHLEIFGLINMNGRVYDPWLGRFLSPDPFVQAPENSQSYNRYTYAFNNPLKYVDPTGYITVEDAISLLFNSDYGGTWNAGDANVSYFSSEEATEFAEDNLDQLTKGGSGETQRSIVTIYNSSGNAYLYDKSSGEIWNSETQTFTSGTDLFPGQMFYDSEGNFAEVFLPGVEIIGSAGGGDNIISDWWNNHWTAKFIPDVIYLNMGSAVTTSIGWGYSSGYALQIRGKEGFGIRPYETGAAKYGVHGAIGLNLGYSSYSGDSRNFSFHESFYGEGTTGYEVDYIFGIGASQSPLDNFGGVLRSYDFGMGPGIGASYNFFMGTYPY